MTQFDLIKTAMNLKTRFIQLKSKIKKTDQKELDEMKNNQKSSKSNDFNKIILKLLNFLYQERR